MAYLNTIVFQDVNSQERFNAIMEYMCTGRYPEYKMINALCSIYGVENVVEKYDYAGGARQTNYKHKRKLKEYVALLTSGQIHFKSRYYFDKSSHYYCQEVEGFEDERGRPTVSYQRYFETFDEFVQYTGRSLKETDLSGAIKLNVDLSLYETDETTKLPISSSENLVCEIKKEYYNGLFVVSKEWKTQTGSSIKKKTFSTHYFFDFVYYLNGDLSDAFLLFCDGLNNIQDYDNINFYGARMKNDLCEKFGVAYEFCELNTSVIGSFAITEKNEEETSIVPLVDNTDIVTDDTDMHSVSLLDDYDRNDQRIHYITDLHLMHRLQNANCKSKDDIRYVLQNVVDNIVEDAGSLLLIGGDVSSDFAVFEIFVRLLNRKIKQKRYGHTDVIFVLGNHELWEFPGKNIDEIVSIYRGIIEENGMYLLHNELLYRNVDDKLCKISYEELISLSTKDVRAQIQSTRIVIFGGIGFSGYNQEFNAEQGVYRATLDRAGEIAESIKFEKLYNQILPAIYDKNSVIFTHTPKKDWAANDKLCTNLVEIYVNYLKLIGGDKDNPLVPVRRKDEVGVLPKEYLSTDIYKASREIKKMQKLTSNILSSWYENTTQKKVGK